ncbi:major intrinsically disordered NOTCH2-binding receptor 1-like [Chiloscyllium plagiosum]|uniref:major intrinsically disordered NOTCH2-binding receptor 1-like n=1 Tax=Chiloscyllium plagiosum TaxID=36176 RepID=UPI001CB875C2|nr:major intrinsically disordered NOTCH2-binding receptor 1-like [Chiloscyllium plagiosum]
MDLSVLPNNNHPDKFLQLDVKALGTNPGLSQFGFTGLSGAALSGRQWHNQVCSPAKDQDAPKKFSLQLYGDGPPLIDNVLSKHITLQTLESTIKRNPLYADQRTENSWQLNKAHPSWTIQDYDRQSEQTNLADHLSKDPNDLKFWLEDVYTPGYDSLLKKKESELKRAKCCKLIALFILAACTLITVITILIVFIGY